MLELLNRQLEAYAASDWNAYRNYLAPNATYEEVATAKRVTGIDAYIDAVKHWKLAFPDLKATVTRTFTMGNTIIAEVEWAGTHRGPLDTPFGTVAATGKFGKVRALLIYRIENDKIVECRHYFDQLTVLLQIGGGAFAVPTARPAQPVVH